MCNCDRALELISLGMDGQLSPEETLELETHLKKCPPCESLAHDLQALHGDLSLLEEDLPEGFHQSVMDRIAGEPVPVSKRRPKIIPLKWLSVAAIFILILTGTFTLPHFLSSPSGNTISADAAAPADGAESQPTRFAAEGSAKQESRSVSEMQAPSLKTANGPFSEADEETATDEETAEQSMSLFAVPNTAPELSGSDRTQLVNACTDWLKDSSLEQKDRVDTTLVTIEFLAPEDLENAQDSGKEVSQLSEEDWKVTLGNPDGEDYVIFLCESTTHSVLGYLP